MATPIVSTATGGGFRGSTPEAQQAFAAQRSGEFNLTPPEVNEAREDAPPGPPAGIAPTAPPPDVAPTVTEAEGGTGVSGSTSGPPGEASGTGAPGAGAG